MDLLKKKKALRQIKVLFWSSWTNYEGVFESGLFHRISILMRNACFVMLHRLLLLFFEIVMSAIFCSFCFWWLFFSRKLFRGETVNVRRSRMPVGWKFPPILDESCEPVAISFFRIAFIVLLQLNATKVNHTSLPSPVSFSVSLSVSFFEN